MRLWVTLSHRFEGCDGRPRPQANSLCARTADELLRCGVFRLVPTRHCTPRTKPSNYPEPFFSRMARREKFGLRNLGVNLTTLLPGGESALLHRHSKQDEFVYILDGMPTLVTDQGETALAPGMCIGFPAA